jgi:hypothetical protein
MAGEAAALRSNASVLLMRSRRFDGRVARTLADGGLRIDVRRIRICGRDRCIGVDAGVARAGVADGGARIGGSADAVRCIGVDDSPRAVEDVGLMGR